MSRVRVDARFSALCEYRWLRRCGYDRRRAWAVVVYRYGWAAQEGGAS